MGLQRLPVDVRVIPNLNFNAEKLTFHSFWNPSMCMHASVPETMKGKFFCIKVWFWNESHIVWEPFQTPIFQLYKAIHSSFSKHTENPKGKHRIH